jgi:hypothetical protein
VGLVDKAKNKAQELNDNRIIRKAERGCSHSNKEDEVLNGQTITWCSDCGKQM